MEPTSSPDDAPAPPQRSSAGVALIAVAALGASAVGAYLYQSMSAEAEKSSIDVSGFDVAQVEAPKQRAVVAAARQAPGSSLNMIGGAGGMNFGEHERAAAAAPAASAGAQAGPPPETNFTQMCRTNETRVHSLTLQYMKRSAVFKRYGEEWMRYPDLKKLNDDYMRNHDPIAFMKGLARSPNFPLMVKKYGTDPNMQAYVKDVLAKAPSGMVSDGLAVVRKDGVVERLMDNVMSAMGLPAGMFAAYGGTGSQAPKEIDQNAVMSQMMGNNPDLQKAMGSMNDPAIQKAIQEKDPEAAAKLRQAQGQLGKPQ